MLQRQTSGSSVIAENLKKFQMQLEKTDNEDKKRLQVNFLFLSLSFLSQLFYYTRSSFWPSCDLNPFLILTNLSVGRRQLVHDNFSFWIKTISFDLFLSTKTHLSTSSLIWPSNPIRAKFIKRCFPSNNFMQHVLALLEVTAFIAALATRTCKQSSNCKSGSKNAAKTYPPSPSLICVVTFHLTLDPVLVFN